MAAERADPDRQKQVSSGLTTDGQQQQIESDVARLALNMGPRNIYPYAALQAAAMFIETSLRAAGYAPDFQRYETHGKSFQNIAAEIPRDRAEA